MDFFFLTEFLNNVLLDVNISLRRATDEDTIFCFENIVFLCCFVSQEPLIYFFFTTFFKK